MIIFSPDEHLSYNLDTINLFGVGGGITARVRIAHALAQLGHSVSLYINCPMDEELGGVEYKRFQTVKNLRTDFLFISSSGKLDLSILNNIPRDAKQTILMVHGIEPPRGMDLACFDTFFVLSNFVRDILVRDWHISEKKIFVSHRGIMNSFFSPVENWDLPKNPFDLVYVGHPEKGLAYTIEVLKQLRLKDQRFHLHVYGSEQLWGNESQSVSVTDGITYHGIIGQKELAKRLEFHTFSINLQTRQEPFGMVLIEAMRAGCVVIASNIGAYPEIVQDTLNGYLIDGEPANPEVIYQVVELIENLVKDTARRKAVQLTAVKTPLDWRVVAESWMGYLSWTLLGDREGNQTVAVEHCTGCSADLLKLPDGHHCVECGQYFKIQ
jgi:glycosyltransferase involved in cell wall biosynthesis